MNVFRLRAYELRFLITLAEEPEIDAVGMIAEAMTEQQSIVAAALEGFGLVDFEKGWRGIGWCRITPMGRDLVRTVRRC